MSKIKVGDIFEARLKKGYFSKTLGGREVAGRLACFSPEEATKILTARIETKDNWYPRNIYKFEKIS